MKKHRKEVFAFIQNGEYNKDAVSKTIRDKAPGRMLWDAVT
jgi:hypothetical protein